MTIVTHADNSFAVFKLVVVHLTMIIDSLLISFQLLGEKLDAGNGLLLVISIADDLVQVSQIAHCVPHKSDQKVRKQIKEKHKFPKPWQRHHIVDVQLAAHVLPEVPPLRVSLKHPGQARQFQQRLDTRMFKVKGCYILKIAGP